MEEYNAMASIFCARHQVRIVCLAELKRSLRDAHLFLELVLGSEFIVYGNWPFDLDHRGSTKVHGPYYACTFAFQHTRCTQAPLPQRLADPRWWHVQACYCHFWFETHNLWKLSAPSLEHAALGGGLCSHLLTTFPQTLNLATFKLGVCAFTPYECSVRNA